jgi:hypothetical protein
MMRWLLKFMLFLQQRNCQHSWKIITLYHISRMDVEVRGEIAGEVYDVKGKCVCLKCKTVMLGDFEVYRWNDGSKFMYTKNGKPVNLTK